MAEEEGFAQIASKKRPTVVVMKKPSPAKTVRVVSAAKPREPVYTATTDPMRVARSTCREKYPAGKMINGKNFGGKFIKGGKVDEDCVKRTVAEVLRKMNMSATPADVQRIMSAKKRSRATMSDAERSIRRGAMARIRAAQKEPGKKGFPAGIVITEEDITAEEAKMRAEHWSPKKRESYGYIQKLVPISRIARGKAITALGYREAGVGRAGKFETLTEKQKAEVAARTREIALAIQKNPELAKTSRKKSSKKKAYRSKRY